MAVPSPGLWSLWVQNTPSGYPPPLKPWLQLSATFIFLFLFFHYFRAAPTAYGSSQARDPVGATAAGLHHSHSNTGSGPYLQPTPRVCNLHHSSWQQQILNPLREARDQTCVLTDTSWIHFHCATTGTSFCRFSNLRVFSISCYNLINAFPQSHTSNWTCRRKRNILVCHCMSPFKIFSLQSKPITNHHVWFVL